jgi:hypothetical protein
MDKALKPFDTQGAVPSLSAVAPLQGVERKNWAVQNAWLDFLCKLHGYLIPRRFIAFSIVARDYPFSSERTDLSLNE